MGLGRSDVVIKFTQTFGESPKIARDKNQQLPPSKRLLKQILLVHMDGDLRLEKTEES